MSEEYENARKKVIELKRFYEHCIVFFIINLSLFLIDVFDSSESYWFYWTSIFWGIGLLFHGLVTGNRFIFSDAWEEKQIQRYLNK